MRVLVCPDKFAGTLSAVAAARAIATGWREARPGDEVVEVPLADGGPGFVEVLHANLGGRLHTEQVQDPLGRPVIASWLEVGDTAYIEAAQANGLALLAPDERDPWRTSSAGVGELIDAARGHRIVVGLGGSGTNDGGRGAVDILGGPVADMLLATDVDSPLLGPEGATYGFAVQKGADPADLPGLEHRMQVWAAQDPELAQAPGAGAAGGLGFGLMLLGGRRVSGIEIVMRSVGLAARCAEADLVITGEGKFDWQSLHGKVVSGVRDVAPRLIVLAGDVALDESPVPAYSLVVEVGMAPAFAEPAQSLRQLARRVALDLDP
ncbi:MAG: glycerate kinase [Candidatus Nanopelagicales bacterium]|jgi:glycerate kinase|nr:glycerate kinase [Candidatus Nanopelagicales bacterium]